MPGLEASAKKLRAEIGKIVDRAAEGRPDLCLVIAPMAAELALEDDLPYETQTTHYGDLRGKNSWERCLAVVSVGQTNLGIRALEAIARCYLADDAQPFGTADVPVLDDDGEPVKGWPYHEVRQRRMRDGTLLPVEVAVHPDPRVQRVLEQIRECEVVQSIDRVRPVFNRRSITLLNSLCVDVTYDRILRHRELVDGGTRWDQAWAATGIIPLGARDLHDMHHAIFRTPPIADNWLKKDGLCGLASAKVNGVNPQTISVVCKNTPLTAYRRQGQRGPRPSHALIDLTRHPDPYAALTAAFGPLAWFEIVAPGCPIVTPPPAPEPPSSPQPLRPAEQRPRRPASQPRVPAARRPVPVVPRPAVAWWHDYDPAWAPLLGDVSPPWERTVAGGAAWGAAP